MVFPFTFHLARNDWMLAKKKDFVCSILLIDKNVWIIYIQFESIVEATSSMNYLRFVQYTLMLIKEQLHRRDFRWYDSWFVLHEEWWSCLVWKAGKIPFIHSTFHLEGNIFNVGALEIEGDANSNEYSHHELKRIVDTQPNGVWCIANAMNLIQVNALWITINEYTYNHRHYTRL